MFNEPLTREEIMAAEADVSGSAATLPQSASIHTSMVSWFDWSLLNIIVVFNIKVCSKSASKSWFRVYLSFQVQSLIAISEIKRN